MKIVLKNINLAQPDVIEELSKFAEREFRIGTTIRIKKIVDELQPILQEIDKYRFEVYKKYSILDEKGNFVHPKDTITGEDDRNRTLIKEGEEMNFNNEMNDLFMVEHTLNSDKIKLSSLGDINLSLKTLSMLDFIFEDDISVIEADTVVE